MYGFLRSFHARKINDESCTRFFMNRRGVKIVLRWLQGSYRKWLRLRHFCLLSASSPNYHRRRFEATSSFISLALFCSVDAAATFVHVSIWSFILFFPLTHINVYRLNALEALRFFSWKTVSVVTYRQSAKKGNANNTIMYVCSVVITVF
jgi:hypothetical protein